MRYPWRWFVTNYYALSPNVANWIRQHEVAKAIVRVLLLPLVGLSWLFVEVELMYQLFLMGLLLLLIVFIIRRGIN